MMYKLILRRMSLLVLLLVCVFSGIYAQATYLCNEKFSSKKPSGWDILPAYSATAPSWKPDTGICMSEKYAMHGVIPYVSGDTATLVTPFFDCTNYKYVTIRFNPICKVLPADVCRIEYQEDVLGSGQKWKVLPYDAYMGGCGTYRQDLGFSHASYTTWDASDTFAKPTNNWWKQEIFDMSDYAGYSKVRFRFVIRKGTYLGSFIAAGWYVDDFQVIVSKYKLNPPALEFTKFYTDTVYDVGPYEFNAKVATRSEGRIRRPWLGYTATYEGKTKKDSIRMTDMDGGDSLWTATIPRHVYGTSFTYWINAADSVGNTKREAGAFISKYFAGGKVKLNGDSTLYGGTSTGIQNCSFPFMIAGSTPSWVKVLYMAEHVRANKSGGMIGAMGFYTTYTAVNSHDNVKIYLKATNITSLTALGNVTLDPIKDGATLVYQGTVTGRQGWNQIKFDRGFMLPANMNLLWYVVDDDPKNACNSSILYWMRNSGVGYNAVDHQGYYSCSGTVSGTVSDLPTTMFYFGKSGGGKLDSNGVAMETIDNPTAGTIAGKQTVKVTIINKGSKNLTSAKLGWSVNGVVQPSVTYKGNLPLDFTDTITLGSYTQRPMAYDTITVWVNTPNNGIDTVTDDDTLSVIAFGCNGPIKGSYMVGASNQYDFPSLEEAFNILERCGIGGDVTLRLATGNYTDNLSISNFNTSGQHRVTITSIAGSADSVVFMPKSGSVVSLNSSAGLVFKNITFSARKNRTYCIQLGTKLNDIEFNHCTLLGFDTSVTSNNYTVIYRASAAPIQNIRFIGNEILGGSYSIYFYGNSTTARNSHIVFDSNHIANYYYYSAYLYYNNNLKMTHNRFDGGRSGYSYDYGVISYYSDSALFNGNRFRSKNLHSYQYSLRIYYIDSFTVISNNEIVLKNTGTTTYGLYVYYPSGSKIINNSILLSGSATSYGLYTYMYGAYYGEIKNNISVCQSTGTSYPLYTSSLTAASAFDVDYNLWYAPTYVAYENGAISSFATHQANIPSAKHDLYKKPSFVYADTSALLADNTGMLCPKVKGIDRDVNGMLRVAQTLRGAYTNELPKMNGALNEFANLPGTTLITDTVRPQVVIMNAGTDTLREATIRVELDGIAQGRDLKWKGQLAVGETDMVSIGSFRLKDGSHSFKAYLTGIGNMKDTIPEDDTISTVTYTCSGLMAGSYTVGSNNADFSTPNDAIKMLTLCGVSAPVTLKLQAGKYGPVGISGTVPGSSSTNTITVMPESGAKVVIDGGAGKAFTLHNSANWHFRNITFGNTTDATVGVELNGKVENVSFRHCNIYASTSA
ncbi:MAG: hypothetical protein IKX13_08330, partial [Bacteroidales bacterium]|nr:hypothetical protein [Bacteroidales bacterium]